MEPFCGQIGTFAFNYAPQDWAECDGSTLSVQQYQVLYAIVGCSFGGTPNQNFKVPDLRGQAIACVGTATNNQTAVYAQHVGHEYNSISPNNLPVHTHPVNAVNVAGDPVGALAPGGKMLAQGFYNSGIAKTRNVYAPYVQANAVPMNSAMVSAAGTANPPAASLLVDNRQPYLVLLNCISTYGNWPNRP
jgi:microcystin-dependent protein